MSNLKGVFLHESDEWGTPKEFYEELDKEFNFNLDPCSTEENHKCPFYFTKETDGLSQNWGGTESFAIHLIQILLNGLKNVIGKDIKKIRWYVY